MRGGSEAAVSSHGRNRYEQALAETRAALDDSEFVKAWSDGCGLSQAELLRDVLRFEAEYNQQRHASGNQSIAEQAGLTAREIETLQLPADGQTAKGIADQLFISPRTASTHVSHIYQKLNVHSQAEAIAWAYQNRLVSTDEATSG